jgi:hypothetical protein
MASSTVHLTNLPLGISPEQEKIPWNSPGIMKMFLDGTNLLYEANELDQ